MLAGEKCTHTRARTYKHPNTLVAREKEKDPNMFIYTRTRCPKTVNDPKYPRSYSQFNSTGFVSREKR